MADERRSRRGPGRPKLLGVTRLRSLSIAALLVVAAAALLVSPALARNQVLAVDITGVHHVDWRYQDPMWPEECNDWSTGSGSQTIGFSTPRPTRYTAMRLSAKTLRQLPKGTKVPKVTWVPAKVGRDKVTAVREVKDWTDHLAPGRCFPCEQEGGGCGPPVDRQPEKPATDCARRTLNGVTGAAYYPAGFAPDDDDLIAPLGDTLIVEVYPGLQPDTYKTCYPDLHPNLRILQPEPPSVSFGGAQRILKLRKGRSATFHRSVEQYTLQNAGDTYTKDRCPKALGQAYSYQECAVTDITVKVTRLR